MAETVHLLVTCLIDTLFPEAGEAAARVLQRAGQLVSFSREQTCCGQPAFNAGMRAAARRMAEHTVRVIEAAPGPVVVPSGSCAAMIRHGYPELFAADPQWDPRVRAATERTYEFSEFLVDVLGAPDLEAVLPERITYHPSCHLLRELGVDRQPRQLLGQVSEAEFVELPDAHECCGFGGLFAVEQPEISGAMLERKLAAIRESGARTVVTCDAGCMLQIHGGLEAQGESTRVAHLAEILDR